MNAISKLIQIIAVLCEYYKKYKNEKRRNDIINNPANEWLSKFGGKDERSKNDTDSK